MISFIMHNFFFFFLLSTFSLYSQTTDNTYNFGTYYPLHLYQEDELGLLANSGLLFAGQKAYRLQTAYTFNQLLYLQAGYERSFLDMEADQKQITNSNFGYAALGIYHFKAFSKSKKGLFKKLPEKYTDINGFLFDAAVSYGFNQNFSKYRFDTYNTKSEIGLHKFTALFTVAYFGRFWGASAVLNTAVLNFSKGKVSVKGPQEIHNFFNAINRRNKFPITHGSSLNVWLGVKQFKIMYSLNNNRAFRDRYYFYFFKQFSQRLSLVFNFSLKKMAATQKEVLEK